MRQKTEVGWMILACKEEAHETTHRPKGPGASSGLNQGLSSAKNDAKHLTSHARKTQKCTFTT